MIKNKKGFTLIELLAVIIVLSIIMVLIIPKTTKVIKKTQLKSIETSTQGLIRAIRIAKHEYAFDNEIKNLIFTFNDGNEEANVPNLTLEYTGKKPENGTIIIDQDGKIALALHDGKYCIEKDFTSDDIIITKMLLDDCNLNIPIYYTDASGANSPRLLKGMTAVVWDESTSEWIEASNIDDPDTQNWFDYGEKKWANAITKDENGDIATFWVWIPRYAYQIGSNFHTSNAGTIDIRFLKGTGDKATDGTSIEISGYNGTTKNTSNNYFLHPAFDFSNDGKSNPIPGFWVAKFEPSGDLNKIEILPNENSLTNSTVNKFYNSAQGMKSYICNGNCDTHMMKNIEWGAVAYLSRSQYGNPNEIWKNAYSSSSKYKTGCSGTNVNDSSSSTCVEWNTENGQRASTTGNVYGIYDMKGGAWEYVAAYVDNAHNNLTNNGSDIVSADLKYKDVYTMASPDNASNNYEAAKNKYGDAIWETSLSGTGSTSWYTTYSSFVYSSSPWLVRGGSADSANAGVFSFSYYFGGGHGSRSFRPVALR